MKSLYCVECGEYLMAGSGSLIDCSCGWKQPEGKGIDVAEYEALQAECEKLREHMQNMIDQTTPLEPVPGNPMWSRRIQLDEVMAERDSLRAECEKLRRDAERYRFLRDAEELPMNLMRLEMIGDVMDSAIDAATQRDKPC